MLLGRARGGAPVGFALVLLTYLCQLGGLLASAPCDYLSAGPGEGPLQRDVEAAVAGEASELVVGALGIKGSDRLYSQWNSTFATYLTEVPGAELNKTFRLVYLDFDTAYRAAEDKCVDFLFTNPSMHLCLELAYGITPIVTLLNFRNGFKLDKFYGTIFTRSNRTDITTIEDIPGKILEAVSVTGLGAAQLQWHEFMINGLDFMNDPSQVRFAYNQQKIVKDVISGAVDVGLVRTDMAEGMAANGVIDLADIKVIHQKEDAEFPFPYSTTIAAPEWPLAAMEHIPQRTKGVIANSMYSIDETFPAAQEGLYASWVNPVSYMGLFSMMGDLGFLRNNRCTGNSDTYDAIICPEGTAKVAQEEIDSNCDALASLDPNYSCPEGYICVCSPCKAVPLDTPKEDVGSPDAGPPMVAIIGGTLGGLLLVVIVGVGVFVFLSRAKNQGAHDLENKLTTPMTSASSDGCLGNSLPADVSDIVAGMSGSQGLTVKSVTDAKSGESSGLTVVELLATSGNSRVYRALWRGATVAQKRIELPSNPSAFQRKQSQMAMEAAISASMSHPNVVQTFSCEIVPIKRSVVPENGKTRPTRSSTAPNLALQQQQEDMKRKKSIHDTADHAHESDDEVVMWEMHIIQEFCNRGSVTGALGNGTVPGQAGVREPPDLLCALCIAKDVAGGMLHIHSLNIIHQDLKSGNVLLVDAKRGDSNVDVIAKVADFGLSVKMDEAQTHISGMHAGTLTHMSPELLTEGRSTKAADVYAYGIFMYELFTGSRPWKGCQPAQIIAAVVQQQRRPVFPPSTPRQIVELATKCWAQDPDERPEFQDILAQIISLLSMHEQGVISAYAKETDLNPTDTSTNSTSSVKKLQQGALRSMSFRDLDAKRADSTSRGAPRISTGSALEGEDEDDQDEIEDTMVFRMPPSQSTAEGN